MATPSPLHVASIQFNPLGHIPSQRLPALIALFEEAASRGAHLAVAPEMALHPYILPHPTLAAAVAEEPEGPTFQALAPLARARSLWMVYGFPEGGPGGRLFNAAGVINSAGELVATYRKTHLFVCDTWWAEAGDGPRHVETPWGTMALGICRDIVEPAFVDAALGVKPRIFAFPTGWVPSEEDETHGYWRGQLGEFGGVFIAADRWGEERGIPFAGRSLILGSDGREVSLGPEGDGVLVLECP